MGSSFGWVDFEEKDRQKMLEVIRMFQESDTRDELGIGTIRDAFSDMFFPGTSTIQTRIKYMLFIPWIYIQHEQSKTSSSEIAQRVRNDEVKLIQGLLEAGETIGVIGGEAKEKLLRMPSTVYWSGLARWGIRKFHGSIGDYHRSLTPYYSRKNNQLIGDDKEPILGPFQENWDPSLPMPQSGFPGPITFTLNKIEAEYLQDKILSSCKGTLFAYLVNNSLPSDCRFIWEHPDLSVFPVHFQSQISHAHFFAKAMNGAALLYNYMLSEKAGNESWTAEYLDLLDDWAQDPQIAKIPSWDVEDFWKIISFEARIPKSTRSYVDEWIRIISDVSTREKLVNDSTARALIHSRERRLKGSRARLSNERALNLWSGAAGTGVLNYRWNIARGMVNDILDGLGQGDT